MDLNKFTITEDMDNSQQDSVGRRPPAETGVHDSVIKMAYIKESSGGANGLHLEVKVGDNSVIYQTEYFTSGRAKGQKNFYMYQNKRIPLPGMKFADQLAQVVAGKSFSQLNTEPRLVTIRQGGQEVQEELEVITDIIGKPFRAGVIRCKENRRAENSKGEYVDIPESREYSKIDKCFNEKGQTAAEQAAGSPANFSNTWQDANPDGSIQDNYDPNAPALPESRDGSAATESLSEDDAKNVFGPQAA